MKRPALLLARLAAVEMVLLTALAGCRPAPGHPADPPIRPEQVTDFDTLFNQNCSGCHGRNGQNGAAIDLGNPEYQALADDDVINSWVSGGVPGTEMPAFAQSAGGTLTNDQITALIAGMRRQWARPNAFGGDTPPPYEQPDTADAARGAQAYRAHCAGCHADSPQQITSRNYLALMADQQLRVVIIAGRPDIGHPDWRHDAPAGQPATPLTADDVSNIVAYLASLRGTQPAGSGSTTQAGR